MFLDTELYRSERQILSLQDVIRRLLERHGLSMGIVIQDPTTGEELQLSAPEIVDLLMKCTSWIGDLEQLVFLAIQIMAAENTRYEQELRVKLNEINHRYADQKHPPAEGK